MTSEEIRAAVDAGWKLQFLPIDNSWRLKRPGHEMQPINKQVPELMRERGLIERRENSAHWQVWGFV